MEYRYPHFKRELLMEDMGFGGGPKPGQTLPDFDLSASDGGRIRKADVVGRKPLLLTCASVT